VSSTTQADDSTQAPEPILLTPDEDRFITFLFQENMNRTRAYMRAYPNAAYDSARSSASRLIAKDNISAEVARRLKEEAMSVDEGVFRLSRIARGSIRHFLRKGPDDFFYININHPEAEEYMFLIKEMEAKRQRRVVGQGEAAEEWEDEWVRVKLYSAYEANIDLLKMNGKFTKKVDLTTGGNPLPVVDHEAFDQSMKAFTNAIITLIEQDQDDSPKPES